MTIALATSATLPQLDIDDQRLLQSLLAMGVNARPVIWDDPTVDWGEFALCVIRSTWDYVSKRSHYLSWTELVSRQTRLQNAIEVIHWNTSKAYLKELEQWGVPIVETAWLSAGNHTDWPSLMRDRNWSEVVVKPVISASGNDTHRVSLETLPHVSPVLDALQAERDVMVQPFLPTVATAGESSFMFIQGRFSHAVVKHPAPNDFRVQEHLGGRTAAFSPSAEQLAFADAVMAKLPWPTLYARVDAMLDTTGQWALSELELTEPSMYLAHSPDASQRFAEAVASSLQTDSCRV